MLRRLLTAAAALLVPGLCPAQPNPIVEDISHLLGPDQVGVDVFADLAGSNWLTAGLFAQTLNAATFVYAQDSDPNSPYYGENDLTGPAANTDSRAITFVSRPRRQDASRRFNATGSPNIWGGFMNPPVQAGDVEVDVAYFTAPSEPTEWSNGYIARVVITGTFDKSLTYVRFNDEPSGLSDYPAAANPTDKILLRGVSALSTAHYPFLVENLGTFAIYEAIPEPASLSLLGFAALSAFRRGRSPVSARFPAACRPRARAGVPAKARASGSQPC